MDDDSRKALEAALLKQPFNAELRERYARVLVGAEDWPAAEEQFALLVQMQPEQASPLEHLALCLLQREEMEGAKEHYLRAKALTGHTAVPELEALVSGARRAGAHLSVVSTKDNVVEFARDQPARVTFADVAGMDALKRTLRLQIIEPFVRPGLFAKFKKRAGGGVLLYGPPGCGKTLMARATAGECAANFIAVGISDVLNMWLGESEGNLAAMFEKARAESPSVLFFDELDALAYSRSKASSDHSRTVVNEFLNQLDGFGKDNDGVLVLAATNMPWDVDPAMKRPGRFSKQVFVPPPDAPARAAMLEMKLAEIPTAADVDPSGLAAKAEYFSGADIDGVIDEARDGVLADIIERDEERPLAHADLLEAIERAHPSTMDWLKTARNLVRFAGADSSYKEVERYLKQVRLV